MPIVVDARMLFEKVRVLNAGLAQEPILRAVGLRLTGWVARNFKDEGTEEKWRPLSAKTIAQRRKNSNRILQDTGRLRMSWGPAAGNPTVLGDTVRVTSNVKYAAAHEFGTKRLPKRRMTPTDRTARDLAIQTVRAAVTKATARLPR
jgi:phage gpG-like protein